MPIYKRCPICGKKIDVNSKCICQKNKDKERYKNYNKNIRYNNDNIIYAKFYNSTAWNRLSNTIKSTYNGICINCLLKKNKIVPYNVIHHIVELREDYSKGLLFYNCIPLCHTCHNHIHSVAYTDREKRILLNELKEYKEKYIC